MKARWTLKDRFQMLHQSLGFTDNDVNLIYAGLTRRCAKVRKVGGRTVALAEETVLGRADAS